MSSRYFGRGRLESPFMSRSVPSSPSVIASAFVAALVAACGHSDKTWDAFNQSKSGVSTNGGGGGNDGTSGTGSVGPQLDCNPAASQQFDPNYMRAYSVSEDVTRSVNGVLNSMDLAGKANQMMGVDGTAKDWQDIERSPDVQVAGIGKIRGYNYRDAGRGVNLDAGQPNNRKSDSKNYATAFPTPSARAASWDLDLEKRVGAAAGDETAASLNNMLLAPCMNIIRHPYWGRTQETYGEDTYHIGRMATAFAVGLQEYVVGCAKHFAANNIEDGRITQNAIMNEQTLREIYGRHFEMVIQDGGIGCIMAAYNMVNDTKCTQNEHLLRTVLKGPVEQGGMGFQGLVISDWWAMPGYQTAPDSALAASQTKEAVKAGLDIEVPWTLHYTEETLGQADQSLVEDAARRVLTQKFRFKTALDADAWSLKAPTSRLSGASIDHSSAADHEALAEEMEVKSAVLLKNGSQDAPVLPLTSATNIAVIGPKVEFSLVSSSVPKSCGSSEESGGQGQTGPARKCTFDFAKDPALGDRGSSRVNADPDPAYSIGPFDGIKNAAPASTTVTIGNSADAAAAADTVVVVVGYTPGDEGEEYAISTGGDRSTLNLPTGQNELVSSVLDQGKPTVIIIESGSIVNLPWLNHQNQKQATIWAGYPGMRGGAALGKLIFGAANFSGKMPMAWPTQAELDVVPFKEDETATHMGYFFGYREYDRRKYVEGKNVDLVFPFGWGMSYSTFEYSNLVVPCESVGKTAIFNVSVDIENRSAVDGDEVALLFVKPPPKPDGVTGDRPWKELKSFARVQVPQGQKVTAQLPLRIQDLRRWEGDKTGRWVIDSGAYTILVGKNAADAETSTLSGTVTVNGD
jgi:beta-glucosidase